MKNKELLKKLNNYISTYIVEDVKSSNDLTKIHGANAFAYGTTPYDTFKEIYDNITINIERFIVVGCSIGWMNFYFNELNPNIKTIGIDIHNTRVDYAKSLVKEYNLNNISFTLESFEDFEFKDGDLIWESNLCFPNELINKCNNNLINKVSDISIISYKDLRNVEKLNDFNHLKLELPVSWMDNQKFHIYEKTK